MLSKFTQLSRDMLFIKSVFSKINLAALLIFNKEGGDCYALNIKGLERSFHQP